MTGASGHIASALIPNLIEAGHEVVGLVRREDAVATVRALGARPITGDLGDLDLLRQLADSVDGVIHLALYDSTRLRANDPAGAASPGIAAINAFGEVLAGTGKPLVSAAAIGALGALGRASSEADIADATGPAAPESEVLKLAKQNVRAVIVRLPLVTHSRPGRRGLLEGMISTARRTGVCGHAGDGANRWPAVHTRDAAQLFRLAFEHGAPGTRWHAVQDGGIPIRTLAELIAVRLDLPPASVPPEDLQRHFGFLGNLIGLDVPSSSELTQRELGWTPKHPTLVDDLAHDDFFSAVPDAAS